MRKILIYSSLTITFLIFGSLGLNYVKDQIVDPLKDAAMLRSDKYVEKIKNVKKDYSFDEKAPVVWNSKILDIKPQPTFLAEQENLYKILGDTTGNWIEVNLTTQTLCFHEMSGNTPCFLVSTGLPLTPTVTGNFHVWTKITVQTMSGPGYYLPGVHWVMYFYQGYSTHEAYWHNNFGHPMSHGCVNMRLADAKYIYDRSEVGTLVNVHY